MLDLLIFAPCDKVIVAEGGQTSMIGVLEQIQVGIAKDTKLVPEAMIPYKWSILLLWHRTQDLSDPIQCQARIVLLRPDGVQALQADAEFEVNNSFRNFRQNVDLPFLPAGMVGQYLMKLTLKKGNEDWKEISTFPIMITHKQTDIQIEQVEGGATEVRITDAKQP